MSNKPVVLITGGASGLGLESAKLLYENNYNVIVFDCNRLALNQIPAHFNCFCVDVTNKEEVIIAIDLVVQKFSHIDVLINNAGLIYSKPLINILNKEDPKHDYDTFKKILDINLNTVFLMGSLVAEKMIMKRTKGVIINMSSICSEGNTGQSAYSAAKAGVNALTKTWSKELGPFGIRVVAISPGFIETESTRSSLNGPLLDSIINRIPMKRLGSPEAVAKLIFFTIQNDYITGSILSIDGGYSL